MRAAEVQAAALVFAVRLAAAHVAQAAIDLLVAILVIADGRHAVADIPLPVAAVSQ